MAKNNLKIEFANETGTYAINVGTTFTDEYSEKLDSASVIISKISKKLNIKPNDEVRIFNENGYIFGKESVYYLVDSVYCKEITLNGSKEYQYTIELKSLTGYLDLIQLPNRALNHSLVSGQKDILYYIKQFVFLYAPKIKFKNENSWEYKRLFKVYDMLVDENGETFFNKFSVPCRDLNFSLPTLRQVLTSLMLQVGCLPKIIKDDSGNVLSYIDLRAPQKIFNIDNSMNYTSFSYASDSYVNVLRNIRENVLDDNNVVINEIIGFRDNESIFVKQKENLKLNTRLPIYNVESMKMILTGVGNLSVKITTPFLAYSYYAVLGIEDGSIGVVGYDGLPTLYDGFSDIHIKGTLYVYDLNTDESDAEYYLAIEKVHVVTEIDADISEDNNVICETSGGSAEKGAIFIGIVTATQNSTSETISGKFIIGSPLGGVVSVARTDIVDVCLIQYPFSVDITLLCVENKKRQLLNTNFLEMEKVQTIEELGQYIYGTVGYSIGGTTIEGFSQMYNKTVAWWNSNYTYLENIVATIEKIVADSDFWGDYADFSGAYKERIFQEKLYMPNIEEVYIRNFEHQTLTNRKEYANVLFDLRYKPLNKLNLTHAKEDAEINIPFEQLDTSEGAISNFNEIMEVEQQKVNRLGNEVVVKNQRTEYISAINDLNTKFDDYIVFNRVISVGIEDFKVNYTASKNYVLQNYFTAIQTKYRAYEYVDYGQSVLRQENTTIYGLISRDYYNGDDRIKWGGLDTYNLKLENSLLSGIDAKYYTKNRFISGASGRGSTYYINDLSIATYKNGLVFMLQMYDSVSYGQKLIPNVNVFTSLGGYEQEWYIKDDFSFNTCAMFLSNTNGADLLDLVNNEKMIDVLTRANNLPLMTKVDTYKDGYNEEIDNYNLMFLVENNTTTSNACYYYADKQEVLNQTIQFSFYTDDDGIKWTEKLWELCNLVCDKPKGTKYIYIGVDEEFGINEKGYTSIDTSKLISYDTDQIALFSGLLLQTGSGFTINWSEIATSIDFMKVVYEENGTYYDLIAVERSGNNASDTIYITLNDTKTDKVAYLKNGLYSFNEYEVVKNTLNRSVKKL